MAVPASREQLKDWCLRQLGHPVIEINVDDDQVEDRIDEAFQYIQQFHFDGVERWYLKHQFTQEDINRGWIPITDNIIGVTRIFPISSSNATNGSNFDIGTDYADRIVLIGIANRYVGTTSVTVGGTAATRIAQLGSYGYIEW